MNLYKKDYIKLYQLQSKFLNWWVAFGLPFYLTGGTALGRFYLNHRYSDDLDFFVNSDPDFSIFNHSKEKALINEIDVEQRLFAFPVLRTRGVDWLIKPMDLKVFERQLRIIADDFMLGNDNSLGKNKTRIDDAMIILK